MANLRTNGEFQLVVAWLCEMLETAKTEMCSLTGSDDEVLVAYREAQGKRKTLTTVLGVLVGTKPTRGERDE